MLTITNLNATIGDKQILSQISITMKPGDVLLVTGHNGSGKSTLLHTVMGRPDIVSEGTIELDNERLDQLECHERARKGIFMFHQTPPTIDGVNTMTLLKEINNNSNAKLTSRELIDTAKTLFNDIGLPTDWTKRQFNLGASGGERKKNELVQAELFSGKVLLLDEPDSGLEQASRSKIVELIEDNSATGGYTLLVTHDKELQEKYSGNMIELKNGRT